ncbi:hypothetical protein [Desulfofundulus thermocisternus]|uniref:hypothetical protein n=1 Tax=Desulfofundulus thermocisternus TaxID=42471 RepID=UPI000484EC74|nr:hypothetical protein [Desulfofundulus thermocisternus]
MADQVLQPNNPFTLFLILILLILSTRPNAEQKLAQLVSLLTATQQSVQIFRSGIETFHAHLVNQ